MSIEFPRICSPYDYIRYRHSRVHYVLLCRICKVKEVVMSEAVDIRIGEFMSEMHQAFQRFAALGEIDMLIRVSFCVGWREPIAEVVEVGLVSSDEHAIARSEYEVHVQLAFIY